MLLLRCIPLTEVLQPWTVFFPDISGRRYIQKLFKVSFQSIYTYIYFFCYFTDFSVVKFIEKIFVSLSREKEPKMLVKLIAVI